MIHPHRRRRFDFLKIVAYDFYGVPRGRHFPFVLLWLIGVNFAMKNHVLSEVLILVLILPALLVAAQMFLAAKGSVVEKQPVPVIESHAIPSVPIFKMPTRSGLIPPPPPM